MGGSVPREKLLSGDPIKKRLSHQHVKFRVRVNQNHEKAISSLVTPKLKILFQQIVGIYHMELLLEQISSKVPTKISFGFLVHCHGLIM
jgi:hypothetical protein